MHKKIFCALTQAERPPPLTQNLSYAPAYGNIFLKVLTLYQGKMTTGRRSSPVPQLNCVGGSAKGMFNPQVNI